LHQNPVRERVVLFAAWLSLCCGPLAAADFPTRPIRLIVPFPPGGNTDILARILGQKVTEDWRQQVVIDNRPGAAGLLGADIVAKGSSDGYTLLMTALGGITVENLKSFAPLMLVATAPSVLVVHPSVKANSVKELLDYARANPGKLNFGSSGPGSQSHLGPELLKSMAKVDFTHIPYKGAGQSIADLLGGQVQFLMSPYGALSSHIKAGKLRALAVTSVKRASSTPDLPTVAESGVPGFEASGWFGMLTPVHVSKEVLTKLNVEFNRALTQPDVRERLSALAMEAGGGSPDDFARFIKADTEKWARIIKEAGITMQ
jgi:tripartite-type tricarboxylate transporter receptor subunit TctC